MAEGQPGEIEPVYLTLVDVLELYGLIINATAAQAADQLRNRDGLESALARPEAYAHYQDVDLALQAAVLAHGIAEGQHFIDGNKRTARSALRSVD
jgi:prophage maintenance system killer protein